MLDASYSRPIHMNRQSNLDRSESSRYHLYQINNYNIGRGRGRGRAYRPRNNMGYHDYGGYTQRRDPPRNVDYADYQPPPPQSMGYDPFGIPQPHSYHKRHRGRPQYKPKARGRGRGRFVHQYIPSRDPNRRVEDLSALTPKIDPVIEKILHQLSCPKKRSYAPKDIVWVRRIEDQWCICIIKYMVGDRQFIVRPLGEPQEDEFIVTDNQIYDTAEALSLKQLRGCIASVKSEVYNVHHIQQDEERDIFQGTLVKCNNGIFGEVVQRHKNGKFSIQIRGECKWYNGPLILKDVSRCDMTFAHEYELKCQILLHENRFHRQQAKQFVSSNEDELSVYNFLNELGDLYIDTFLDNGITNIKIALCLQEADLKEMEIKLGHRRYILKRIQTFGVNSFDANERNASNELIEERKSSEDRPHPPPPPQPKSHNQPSDLSPKLIIYDFDCTLTCTDLYYDAPPPKHGDPEAVLDSMSDERLLEIFGGRDRVKRLTQHFKTLTQHKVEIAIVSFAYVSVIKSALKRLGLFEIYFKKSVMIGGDSIELERYDGSKAKYILNTLVRSSKNSNCDIGWDGKDILFVDDDPETIKEVNEQNVCKSILIDPRNGLADQHMSMIENMISKGGDDPKELEGIAYCNNENENEYEGPNPTQ